VDWEAGELDVLGKGKKRRRVTIDPGLREILERRRAAVRTPGKGKTKRLTRIVRARFTTAHVFTTSQQTPIAHNSCLWSALRRCCKLAGIPARDERGRVDVHSLRRTFATEAIDRGSNPKVVQELLGHATLHLTMSIYAKARPEAKQQAVAGLGYASGDPSPEPATGNTAQAIDFPENST
jgi:integrase